MSDILRSYPAVMVGLPTPTPTPTPTSTSTATTPSASNPSAAGKGSETDRRLVLPALRDTTMDAMDPALTPSDHDLLIEVRAISVNPIDFKIRSALGANPPAPHPKILGWDAAGIVVKKGGKVREFKEGDRVYYAGQLGRSGCNAYYQLVSQHLVAHAPQTLNDAHAASLPLTAITAWESLFDQMGIHQDGRDSSKTLLVIGGAGGVGSMAIQLAKKLGRLRVIATASRSDSISWCLNMGADETVSHATPSLTETLKTAGVQEVDYVLVAAGVEPYWLDLPQILKPFGTVVMLVDAQKPLDINIMKPKSIRMAWEFMFARTRQGETQQRSHQEILKRLAHAIDSGHIRSTCTEITGAINAANLAKVHDRLQTGRVIGKIALQGWQP